VADKCVVCSIQLPPLNKWSMPACPNCTERADFLAEIQRLQKALNFWLPSVPMDGDKSIIDRIAHDAQLLAGYNELEVPEEKDAQTMGWIELMPTIEEVK